MKTLRQVLLLSAGVVFVVFTGSVCGQIVTAISNIGQSTDGVANVGSSFTNQYVYEAVSFTTGSDSFDLSGVALKMSTAAGSPAGFAVFLYSTLGGSGPSGLLTTFAGNSTPSSSGTYAYTPGSTVTLQPSSTYWVVTSALGSPLTSSANVFQHTTTFSTAEDMGGFAGWSIGDDRWLSNDSGGSWFGVPSSSGIMKFSVEGSAIPEPSTYALGVGFTILSFTLFRKRNHERPQALPGTSNQGQK